MPKVQRTSLLCIIHFDGRDGRLICDFMDNKLK